MERTITYKITDSGQNIRIDSFLRKHGYSMQNLTLLKKMPESILKNGEWSYMQTTLQAGDILTVRIQEETSSPNIPAVNLPIDIVYEDEDIIVADKEYFYHCCITSHFLVFLGFSGFVSLCKFLLSGITWFIFA